MAGILAILGALLFAAGCSTAAHTGSVDATGATSSTMTDADSTTLPPTTLPATTPTTVRTTTPTNASAPTTVDDADHADTDDATDVDRTIEVVMTEFAFSDDPVDVAAGETVKFVVTNAGAIPHEFRLSNDHRIEEHLASGHDDHENTDGNSADGGHHEGGDVVLVLEAGDTSSVVVTFSEDVTIFTEVACLLPGHYEAGMFVEVHYTA